MAGARRRLTYPVNFCYNTPMHIDWPILRGELVGRFLMGEDSIHGPAHWERVERHGMALARRSGGDLVVVRLFALFHDVCRVSDHHDDDHGARGAELALRLRGELFEVSDARFHLLRYACVWHTAGQVSADPTIGACWDADRLDLWRAGIIAREALMSTEHARRLVRNGQVGKQFTPSVEHAE